DTELPVYAAHRDSFASEGVLVAVSSQETIDICRDKVRTHSWLGKHGFPTVEQWCGVPLPSYVPFPVIVKPRHGSASVGVCLPQAFGAMNFQCFLGVDGVARITEINGRFGGGYPLAYHAGADFPRWLIEAALGREVDRPEYFDQWDDGCTMLRYDDAVYVKKS